MTHDNREPAGSGAADPRLSITPESFAIAPDLLGLPLARPWRRAAAVLVDLIIVALLTKAGGVLLAAGAAFALWRASAERAGRSFARGWVRFWLRAIAVLIAFVAVLSLFTSIRSYVSNTMTRALTPPSVGPSAAAADHAVGRTGRRPAGLADIIGVAVDLKNLKDAKSAQEAQGYADAFVARLEAQGVPRDSLALAAQALARDHDAAGSLPAYSLAALRRALSGEATAPAPAARTAADPGLARAYADAVSRGDSARADSVGSRLAPLVAADTIAHLNGRIDELQRRSTTLAAAVDREAKAKRAQGGIMGTISRWANELGLGIGWIGLYFTAFLALWSGQTPGKRLLGIRVLRLDGERIGWWAAFERFGGYTAGFATGLGGFAQVLWDRNRQAIHDKICETVVVRDTPRAAALARGEAARTAAAGSAADVTAGRYR